jgi:hypothetical protein
LLTVPVKKYIILQRRMHDDLRSEVSMIGVHRWWNGEGACVPRHQVAEKYAAYVLLM